LNISNHDVYTRVQPYRAWALLPAAVTAGAVYELAGYRAALVLLSLLGAGAAALQCVAVVLRPGRARALVLFQTGAAVSGFNFSAGFVVNCAMFALLSPGAYQAASSANSIAMMLGSLAASFVGQGLVHVLPTIGDLLWVPLAMAVLELLVVAAGALCGALGPAAVPLSAREWVRRVWAKLRLYHTRLEVCEWSLFSAVVLATHTLVKGMWKSLFQDINPDAGQVSNGIIFGSTCAAAAVAMLLMNLVPRATEITSRAVLCVSPFVFAGIFAWMALAKTVLTASILLVAYNVVSECALVVASTMMGKAMQLIEHTKAKQEIQQTETAAVVEKQRLIQEE
jgi:hypothetical protein